MTRLHCPACHCTSIIKRGKRKGTYRDDQLYYCKDCGKRFVNRPVTYRKYPMSVVFCALNYYNLGYSLEKTRRQVSRDYRITIARSTIYAWIKEFQTLCPIASQRDAFAGQDDPLFMKHFDHDNLKYEFQYHRYKLGVLARDAFPRLCQYITRFEQGCPDVFFEVGERCSHPRVSVDISVKGKNNLACTMAAFAVQAARTNLQRHKVVERFILINDTATVACELPVWYWEKNIDAGITGHIDMVQVRNNRVYVLDYKPDAALDKKAGKQLYHYATALSLRTGIPLRSIRCAWFDEQVYFEYNPASVKVVSDTSTK